MKSYARFSALAMLAALSFSPVVAHADTPVEVTFDGPGDVELAGVLYTPTNWTAGSNYRAVVMMHGCSGMWSYSIPGSYSGGVPNLQNNVEKWGLKLASQGIVALAVDSYTPRTPAGVTESEYQHQCKNDDYESDVNPYTERPLDARAAHEYLSGFAQIDSSSIGLLGWSNGAQAAMVEAAETPLDSNTARPGSELIFAATVLFYPGCGADLGFGGVANSYWRPYDNLRMNMGMSDNFYSDCNTRMNNAINNYSAPVVFEAYTGAGHSFDGGSQSWPAAACASPFSGNTCAMNDADIDSLAFFQANL